MAISTINDGVRRSPSTLTTSPIGPRCSVGGWVICATTIWPDARAAILAGRDQHILIQAAVVRRDHHHAVLHHHTTDQPHCAAFEHLDDRALLASAAIQSDDARQYAITMQNLAHLRRRNVDIVAACIRPQKTEAFGVGDDGARNQAQFLCHAVSAAAVLQQLAIAQHRGEAFAQRVQVARIGETKFPRQALRF